MYPSSLQQPNLALPGHRRWNIWTNVKENHGILSNVSLDYRYQYKGFADCSSYVLYTWWVGIFGWVVQLGKCWSILSHLQFTRWAHVYFKQISEVVESHDICWNLHRFNCSFFSIPHGACFQSRIILAINPKGFFAENPQIHLTAKKIRSLTPCPSVSKVLRSMSFSQTFPMFFSSFQLQPPPAPPILVLH